MAGKMSVDGISRRDFLRVGAGAGLAAAVSPAALAGAVRKPAEGKPVRVGCIGVGGRGRHLLGHVLAIPGVEVAAICDLDRGNREAAAAAVEKAFGTKPETMGEDPYTYRKLLAREDLHAVVIATPCYWHGTMYVDALNAGMNFYGEKPLAITAGELKAVLEAYQGHRDVAVQIGFQWGAHPGRRRLFKLVQDGAIGELLDGQAQRPNGWDGHGGWYADRTKSGDWMLEQAVHEFNLIWSVVGTHPVRAYTAGRSGIIPGRDTTNYYTTILEYPGRLVLRYSHSWIAVPDFPSGGLYINITGTKGAINVMDAYIQLREKPAGGEARIAGEGGGDTREHMTNFFDCVRAGTPQEVYCGIPNGAGASIIGLMIRQSLEMKRPVTFEETLRDSRKPPVPPA
ncbi:MAG: Gfo/Idh/MocA family oxidoreductase [Planctomycetes bacterium]|nr:Gfo/Idh/MocA family oxidoreductase [Planctomycetota bacterium]